MDILSAAQISCFAENLSKLLRQNGNFAIKIAVPREKEL